MFDSAEPLIIGVDGGGTGCRAAVGTCSTGILAQASGGAANFATDPDLALANVTQAVTEAAIKAGASTKDLIFASAHIGLAGVMSDGDGKRIADLLPYKAVSVTDDRPTSTIGALGAKDGYLLSVGTGTIAAASIQTTFRYVGGWGFHVADQASGAWLGRAALEQVLLCYDSMAKYTGVTRSLFSKFDDDPNQITAFSMSATPGDFGKFAPDVVRGAANSDPWAVEIMNKGAAHLTGSLMALGFHAGDPVCLSGGVGPHYAGYLDPEIAANVIQPSGNALDGAFHLACQNARKHPRSKR
ncbi:MAG: BadF/BadG/BcrA/BcrD ATPase family protein [Aliishimia sp.]